MLKKSKKVSSKSKRTDSEKNDLGIKIKKLSKHKLPVKVWEGNFWSMRIAPAMGQVVLGSRLRLVYILIVNHGPGKIALHTDANRIHHEVLPGDWEALVPTKNIAVESVDKKSALIYFRFNRRWW
jgi:hypothetical protein